MKKGSKAARISAIICTYNREDVIATCLDAMLVQTLPQSEFEVIVVDNASTDGTGKIADAYAKKRSNIRAIREDKQGLAAARNRGLREATSGIAAFTDDDAIPSADWLAKLLGRFDSLDDKTVAVGGEIDPIWEVGRPEWLTDKMLQPLSASLNWSTSARYLLEEEWLCEVNSAYKIEPLVAMGGFPEHLGRIGTNLLSGENVVNRLLAERGYKFFFDPEIRVRHLIPRSRTTREWFQRRMFWQGVTTFYVNQVLRENGCAVPYSADIEVPLNEEAWLSAFDKSSKASLERSMKILFNFGYLLASQGLLTGR